MQSAKATTVVAVQRNGQVAMAGDGQVTVGNTVMKHTAKKVRRLYHGKILAGFAGAVADSFTLFDRFEAQLDTYKGQLTRSVVELAKEWRSDKVLRRLESLLVVADLEHLFVVTGTGELIEPESGVIAIGSGGSYALAAGKALLKHTDLSARDIAVEAMRLAAEICIYTNDQIMVEVLG